MLDNQEIARKSIQSIKNAITEAKAAGLQIDAVFIGTDLRYLIAAQRDNLLEYSEEVGETVLGIKVIRYMSDDRSQFFLATSHAVSPELPVNPVHRPYMRKKHDKKDD